MKRPVWGLLTLYLAAASQAALIWSVPDDPVMGANAPGVPKYFSGCNSRAFASAESAPMGYGPDGTPMIQPTIIRSELHINGTLVSERNCAWHPIFGFLFDFKHTHSIMFDPTAFAYGGGPITVVLRVWEAGDSSAQERSYSAPSRSSSFIAARYDFNVFKRVISRSTGQWTGVVPEFECLPTVQGHLANGGYAVSPLSTLGWSAPDFLNGWFMCNNILSATHGSPGGPDFNIAPPRFSSDRKDDYFIYPAVPAEAPADGINGYRPNDGSTHEVTSSGYEFWRIRPFRVTAIGTGLPPFNSGEQPPINFYFVYACSVGVADGGSSPGIPGDSLYPNGNVYTGVSSSPENQAVLMSTGGLPVASKNLLDVFYGLLLDGYSVRDAADKVFEDSESDDDPFMVVKGDHATRIKNVYVSDPYVVSQYPFQSN